MNQYDVALKNVLRRTGGSVLREVTGLTIERWHNVELSEVRQRSVDLLGETADGQLVHIELQSSNDGDMALRMAEYALGIRREFGRFPEQVVLYVGLAALRMVGKVSGPHLRFECRMVDIRELDGERLIESASLADNVVGVLARLRDQRKAVRHVLERIEAHDEQTRTAALRELLILAKLRRIEAIIMKETQTMPLLDSIMDHEILGPEFRRGLAQGEERGLAKGEKTILRRQFEARFGPLPGWAEERLSIMTAAEAEEVAVRFLDAASLAELLR
jgi:predicted transposase/invertase (TIGR01784 family)